MDAPAYVKHDGQRWHVRRTAKVDGAPAYVLQQSRGPRLPPRVILARASECEPWQRPLETLRIFRDGRHVLEIHVHGCQVRRVAVRSARSSKRWPTSIAAIHSMTVKAAVSLEKARRKAARRAGR